MPTVLDQRMSEYRSTLEYSISEEKMALAIPSRPSNSHLQMLLLGSLRAADIPVHNLVFNQRPDKGYEAS